MDKTPYSFARIVAGTALVGTLAGCVGYVDPPPPPVYVAPVVVEQDDYVYYPRYRVYYSSRRHDYIYMEGRSWVTRPAPPRVTAEVLFRSPSVQLEFHDAPSRHHAEVVRRYPKRWSPPPGRSDHGKGHDQGNRR